MTCQSVSYSLVTNSSAGMLAGAASGAVVSCMSRYIQSPLIKESPFAAVVPPLGFYAGLLASLPCLGLSPRLFPQIRSMLYVSIAITAVASSLFSLGGVDMSPVNSTSLGVGVGAVTGIFTALFFCRNLFSYERDQPEPPFTWKEIKGFFPSRTDTILLNITNVTNGILAGIASGFLVAFLAQKIPESSVASAIIPPVGYTAALLTSVPFIAAGRCLHSPSSREIATINAIFTSALVGLLASGGLDMSCMRSAATGAGMGAAMAPVIVAGFSCIQGLSNAEATDANTESAPFISPDASCCDWIPVGCVLAMTGAFSGATSGALSSKIGELTKDSFAIVTVAPTALTAGIIAGCTPIFLLSRTKCLDQRVISVASTLSALTAMTSSVIAMGGADMPLVRSTAAGAGSGLVIGASALCSFLVLKKLTQ